MFSLSLLYHQKQKKFKLFKIKHTILLEGETFFKNEHKIAFFLNKVQIFLVEKKTPSVQVKNISFLRLFFLTTRQTILAIYFNHVFTVTFIR